MHLWTTRAGESLNFQISFTIYGVVLGALAFVFGVVTLGLGLLAILPAALVFGLAQIILVIAAAVSANAGTPYRYPFTIQFFTE